MTLRAWVNLAHRRGYLLEGAHGFLVNRGAAPGDTLLFYRETHRSPPVRASPLRAPVPAAVAADQAAPGNFVAVSLVTVWPLSMHHLRTCAAQRGGGLGGLRSFPAEAR